MQCQKSAIGGGRGRGQGDRRDDWSARIAAAAVLLVGQLPRIPCRPRQAQLFPCASQHAMNEAMRHSGKQAGPGPQRAAKVHRNLGCCTHASRTTRQHHYGSMADHPYGSPSSSGGRNEQRRGAPKYWPVQCASPDSSLSTRSAHACSSSDEFENRFDSCSETKSAGSAAHPAGSSVATRGSVAYGPPPATLPPPLLVLVLYADGRAAAAAMDWVHCAGCSLPVCTWATPGIRAAATAPRRCCLCRLRRRYLSGEAPPHPGEHHIRGAQQLTAAGRAQAAHEEARAHHPARLVLQPRLDALRLAALLHLDLGVDLLVRHSCCRERWE